MMGTRNKAAQASVAPWVDAMAVFAERSDYLDFVRGTEPVHRFPVLLELHRPSDLGALRQAGIDVPPAYGQACLHVTASLREKQLLRLKQGRWQHLIRRWELQLPVVPGRPAPAAGRPGAMPPAAPDPLGAPLSDREVLIGIIDTGCPFAHAAYLEGPHHTRVLRLWDQDRLPALTPLGASIPPNFGYGAEASRWKLNAWMGRFLDDAGGVDEDACYREARYDMVKSAMTHGAAVMGLAAHPMPLLSRYPEAGTRPPSWSVDKGAAASADIVFVQLPRDVVQDSSSAGLLKPLLDGLRYIVDCAGPKTRRVVINISDGTSRTLHDGSAIIESAMSRLVAEAAQRTGGRLEVRIALAAGNAFAEARHAQLDSKRQSVDLHLPVQCECATFVTLHVPASSSPPRLVLRPPGASPGDELVVRQGHDACWPPGKRASCWVVYPPAHPDMPTQALIVWAPTSCADGHRHPATPGRWTIGLAPESRRQGLPSTPVHLWISRNQQNVGALARGRQARFIDADGRYDPQRPRRCAEDDPGQGSAFQLSAIRRRGSLNGLATGAPCPSVKVIGSAMMLEAKPSLYSSEGPGAGPSPARDGPDGHYPTDWSRSCEGVRAPGARSGAVVQVMGTSFAVPQAVRDWANGVTPPVSKLNGRRPFPT